MNDKKNIRTIPFNRIIPNIITMMAICIGFSGIRFALAEHWSWAMSCLLIAAVLDGLDGRVARLLGGTSRFGAELDSLADACNFGIVPALIIYLYSLHNLGNLGWAVSLFFVICMIFRLARFNTLLNGDEEEKVQEGFFLGLAAPVGALYAMLPLVLDLYLETYHLFPSWVYGLYLPIIALLTMSRIPTFSIKAGSIPKKYGWLIFICIALYGASFVTMPWLSLLILCAFYAALIPFSITAYTKNRTK